MAAGKNKKKYDGPTVAVQGLAACAGVLFLTACFYYFRQNRHVDFSSMDSMETSREDAPPEVDLPKAKPYVYYEDVLRSRDVFQKMTVSLTADSSGLETPQGGDLPGVLRNMRLAATVFDPSGRAVLEDKRTRETYYLTEGTVFKNAVVEEILDGKIIFTYQNRNYEIGFNE